MEEQCRASEIEVIFVAHNTKNLNQETDGCKIYHKIQPLEDEVLIEKRYNSAFKETPLLEYLDEKSIDTIIVCGFQSEYLYQQSGHL